MEDRYTKTVLAVIALALSADVVLQVAHWAQPSIALASPDPNPLLQRVTICDPHDPARCVKVSERGKLLVFQPYVQKVAVCNPPSPEDACAAVTKDHDLAVYNNGVVPRP